MEIFRKMVLEKFRRDSEKTFPSQISGKSPEKKVLQRRPGGMEKCKFLEKLCNGLPDEFREEF